MHKKLNKLNLPIRGNKLYYEKMYTRENCLLIYQMWQEDMSEEVKTLLDNPPNTNFAIYDVTEGVSNGYYDNETLSKFEKHLIKKIRQDKEFVPKAMKWFEEKLSPLEKIWKGDRTLKRRENIIDFYHQTVLASAGLDVAYFTPKIREVSSKDRKLAMNMRKRSDDFTPANNRIITQTLERLYPKLGKYSQYLSIDELKMNKIPAIKILKERYKHYIYFNHKIFTNISFEEFTKKLHLKVKKEKITQTNEIKGQIGMSGVVTGKIRVIIKRENIVDLKTGEILVSPMTTMDFMPAMRKAAAIITDEGGITCHAAIIARELKKPCIIGTKIATKIFKTGDYVEVDATKGIVRRIMPEEVKQTIKKKLKQVIKTFRSQKPATKIRPELILWLKDLKKGDISTVGGKGANLGELFNHFTIPNGFCVTVNSYKRFLKETGLDEDIRNLLDALDVNNNDQLEKVSKKIRTLILEKPFPKDIEKLIKENYLTLKNKKVAIRSSATAEDLPNASFAGQQDTYLNIKGEKSVSKAVQKCWASLFTARAIHYRVENKFKHKYALISVVVQEMVDADYAGVMFTVDPVNKKYILIETVNGLGEALVSGKVTPNSYFVHKSDEKIMEKVEHFNFNEKLIYRVADLGRKIELHYRCPMDVEYAIKDNKIYILQARPITTL